MDVSQLINTLSLLAHKAGNDVEDKMTADKLTDPASLLRAQFAVQQYSIFINYSSAILKTMKDMVGGIIAKI
uniref:Putative type III secretion system protein SsaG n=1 Tax=Candidatus Sodalis melophagi TaxID=1173031 RepID=I6PE36_9GAMM|nr:putative type III secretion system protein SsaG [Candidatus Sodalis melophagi]